MNEYRLLIDLHRQAQRQGPGSDAETEKAIALAGLDPTTPLKIADIGCGTGAAALVLARRLNAHITAVDFLPDFFDVLAQRAERAGLSQRITPLAGSMDSLPFVDEEYDVLWSEGAIYNIGFARGIADWKRYLKPGGLVVVSEITWTTAERPPELQAHWMSEYPEIDLASAKIGRLEQSGYAPIGYFVLPPACWLDTYYRPMQERFRDFLARHGNSEEARAIVETEQREIELYEQYSAYYSYGVYIARKPVSTAG